MYPRGPREDEKVINYALKVGGKKAPRALLLSSLSRTPSLLAPTGRYTESEGGAPERDEVGYEIHHFIFRVSGHLHWCDSMTKYSKIGR